MNVIEKLLDNVNIKEEIPLNEEQETVLNMVKEKKNIFITGPGGTGKTFLIHRIVKEMESVGKKVAVTSLTGLSALLIGEKARTIHSWSGLGIANRSVMSYFEFVRKCLPKKREAWRTTDILIIDEISMMSDEFFEKLDELGRLMRWRHNEPFGGIQILCFGDFLQLPPINSKFVFESPKWNETLDCAVFLNTVYRQTDPVFQNMLNEIRLGHVSDETDRLLKSRLNLDFSKEEIQPTKIFTRKAMVEEVNKSSLDKIEGETFTYKIITKGKVNSEAIKNALEKMDQNAPYVPELSLKVGAQVMLIVNTDIEFGLVNGKLGIVVECRFDSVLVRFKGHNYPTLIKYHNWILEDYESVYRSQIPLILSYAITTHKAQGATLDSAYIDIGLSVFEYGQAYVALSRVKSLESLYLHSYNKRAIRAHPKVVEYYESLLNDDE
jgi:ATP-dependent DNA helicase PIF1